MPFGFGKRSWRRLSGVSNAQRKVSRAIGVPLSEEGRRRKFGPGCAILLFTVVCLIAACSGAGNPAPVGNTSAYSNQGDPEPWTENHIPAWVGQPLPEPLPGKAMVAFEAVERNIKVGFLDGSWSAVSIKPNAVRMPGDSWRKNTGEFQKNVAAVFSLYFKVKGFGPSVEFLDNDTGEVLSTVGEDGGFHTEKAAPGKKKKARR